VNPLDPPKGVLIKLGSIARHADEVLSPGAHELDVAAIKSLLVDPEVVAWMAAADVLALLPVKR
jgi:hypothetical protein